MSTHASIHCTKTPTQVGVDWCDGRLVARVTGDLDVYTAQEVKQSLCHLAAARVDLVLDLAGVEFIDSAGLRVVHIVAGRLREEGRALIVRCPDGHLTRILQITGLLEQIRVVSDLTEIGRGNASQNAAPGSGAGIGSTHPAQAVSFAAFGGHG
jgi:anti-anti-sigma factor